MSRFARRAAAVTMITLITLVGSSVSFADQITSEGGNDFAATHNLVQTATPIAAKYPNASLDILGIKPGMSLGDVKKVLSSFYKSEPESVAGVISSSYKDAIFIKSQSYTSMLHDENKDKTDYINVYFGNQTTGNTVIAIDRKITFNVQTGPKIAAIISALGRKYGPETNMNNANQPTWDLHWDFGAHKLINSCSASGCNCPTIINVGDTLSLYDVNIYGGSLDVRNAYSHARTSMSSSPPEYACVDAEAYPLDSDKSRAMDLEVIVNDPADEILTLKGAEKQLHDAAAADYQKEVKPVNVPKL